MTRPTLTAAMVTATLKAAGHAEAGESRNVGITVATTGFHVFAGNTKVTVAMLPGDDMESCHPEAPGVFAVRERLIDGYREALEAAGYTVAARGMVLDVTSAPREG